MGILSGGENYSYIIETWQYFPKEGTEPFLVHVFLQNLSLLYQHGDSISSALEIEQPL